MTKKVLLLITVLAAPAYAELPPGSYDTLRIEAQEALILQVESAKTQDRGTRIAVVLTAKVLTVERSKAGLKKGGTITIRYETIKGQAPPGPRPLSILKTGEVYPAFLNKAADGFEPAAYGESFKMTPDL